MPKFIQCNDIAKLNDGRVIFVCYKEDNHTDLVGQDVTLQISGTVEAVTRDIINNHFDIMLKGFKIR